MTRQDALALAQQKADDWKMPYRALRCTDKGEERMHKVEQSDSYDSPRGFVLVEVVFPKGTPPARCRLSE